VVHVLMVNTPWSRMQLWHANTQIFVHVRFGQLSLQYLRQCLVLLTCASDFEAKPKAEIAAPTNPKPSRRSISRREMPLARSFASSSKWCPIAVPPFVSCASRTVLRRGSEMSCIKRDYDQTGHCSTRTRNARGPGVTFVGMARQEIAADR
jgi:hypothetical protein